MVVDSFKFVNELKKGKIIRAKTKDGKSKYVGLWICLRCKHFDCNCGCCKLENMDWELDPIIDFYGLFLRLEGAEACSYFEYNLNKEGDSDGRSQN